MSDNEAAPEGVYEDAIEAAYEAVAEAVAEEGVVEEAAVEVAAAEEAAAEEAPAEEEAADEEAPEEEAPEEAAAEEAAPQASFIETLLPRMYVIQEHRPDDRIDHFIGKLETYLEEKQAAAEAEAQAEAERLLREAIRQAAEEAAREIAREEAIQRRWEQALADAAIGGPRTILPDRTVPDPAKYASILETFMYRILEERMQEEYVEPTVDQLADEPLAEGEDEFAAFEGRTEAHWGRGTRNQNIERLHRQWVGDKYRDGKDHPQVRDFFEDEFDDEPRDFTGNILDRVSPQMRGYYDRYVRGRRNQDQ